VGPPPPARTARAARIWVEGLHDAELVERRLEELTRRLLPVLRTRPHADIHTVVSMSGLPYARMRGSSAAFVAAKAGQSGFVQALTEELIGTKVRLTSVYPGIIEDVLPMEAAWHAERGADDMLSDRNVVEAILYILSQPPNVAIRSLVIERARTDFLS
jgi:NADP-dependent 3-hydroxy acid dehydrogenase YdfG